MTELKFRGKPIAVTAGQTVLDSLLQAGEQIGSSCRAGVCQSCLLKGEGEIPSSAQRGLKASLVAQGYFLACQCPADIALDILDPEHLPLSSAKIEHVERMAPDILRLLVSKPPELEFEAGQFLSVVRPEDGLTRSYSIASLPDAEFLELHVALLPGGRMGEYLKRGVGVELSLRGAYGDCFYLKQEQPLLLAGTGTGLAPLLGILRAALANGHQAPIYVFHGARDSQGLYLREQLQALSESHGNFQYFDSALSTGSPDLFALVRSVVPSLSDFRVYLCGAPDFVQKMRKQCFLAGASMKSIHSDPFILATPNSCN